MLLASFCRRVCLFHNWIATIVRLSYSRVQRSQQAVIPYVDTVY